MIVANCSHSDRMKHGHDKRGIQRYLCKACGKTFADEPAKPLGTMRLPLREGATALAMLLEGLSIRSAARLTGIDRDTIGALILTAGENCERFFLENVRGVAVEDCQCDELWSYIALKERKRMARHLGDALGDSWTFIAMDARSKLVLAYEIGRRDAVACYAFIDKLRDATKGYFQVSTDGFQGYKLGVPFGLGDRVSHGVLIKSYESTQTETRYSPAQIVSIEKHANFGDPDQDRVSTSYVERLNLTLRMQLRRFTRLTNGFSKSPRHHRAMQSIFFAWFNWVRVHGTIKTTPAVAAGLADRPWTVRELLERAA